MRKIIIWCVLVVMAVFVGSCEEGMKDILRPDNPTYEDLSNILYYDLTITASTLGVVVKSNDPTVRLGDIVLKVGMGNNTPEPVTLVNAVYYATGVHLFAPGVSYKFEITYNGKTNRATLTMPGTVTNPGAITIDFPDWTPPAALPLAWTSSTSYKYQLVEVNSHELSLTSFLNAPEYSRVIPGSDRNHTIPANSVATGKSLYEVSITNGNFTTDGGVAFIVKASQKRVY